MCDNGFPNDNNQGDPVDTLVQRQEARDGCVEPAQSHHYDYSQLFFIVFGYVQDVQSVESASFIFKYG